MVAAAGGVGGLAGVSCWGNDAERLESLLVIYMISKSKGDCVPLCRLSVFLVEFKTIVADGIQLGLM